MPDQQADTTTVTEPIAPDDFAGFVAWRENSAETETVEGPSGDSSESETAADSETAGDPDETEVEEEEDESEEKPHKGKRGVQKRINELTREKRELEERVGRLERDLTDKDKPAEPEKKLPEGKPKVEDFEDYSEYVDALIEWKHQQKTVAEATRKAEAERNAEAAAAGVEWDRNVKALQKEPGYADYAKVIDDVEDVPIPAHVAQLLRDSKDGPRLAYALAKDREVLEALVKMRPLAAAKEIGKLESSLPSKDKTQKTPTKQTSTAPKPIPPSTTNGKSTAAAPDIYDERTAADFTKWKQLREKQLSRK